MDFSMLFTFSACIEQKKQMHMHMINILLYAHIKDTLYRDNKEQAND